MGRPTIHIKFKLSRNLLVRILSQQLAGNWRGRPRSQKECLARATEYLTGVLTNDLHRLRQLYEGAKGPEGEAELELLGGDDEWQKSHLGGLRCRDQATEIVDDLFPHLSPQLIEAQSGE